MGGRFSGHWQRLNGGFQPRDLMVNKVLSLVGHVASPLASKQEDHISQGAPGLPDGLGAGPQVRYSHPKPLRRDCDGWGDDDLRSVTVGVSVAVVDTGAFWGSQDGWGCLSHL